jgi:hypothetical protein
MKHLRSFSLFESQTSVLTTDQEAFLNEYIKGTWSVNRQTGLVDVEGNFACSSKRLKSLSGISFGHVSGNFACFNNQLTSLKGAPQTVGGGFDCSYNDLTSLEGAPQTVGRYFFCESNKLTSLEGAPQTVGWGFDCSYNDLTSLEGAPRTVGVNFLSDKFQLEEGEWNMAGWLKVLNTGTPAAKKLILTLPGFQPDWWNSELQRDPGKTVHLLATVWNHMPKDMQSAIKIPKGYEGDLELFSGFDELGLF